jgi:hypothetical protein
VRALLTPTLVLGLAWGCAPADVPWPGPGPSPGSAAELRLARLARHLAAETPELDPISEAAEAWPDVEPEALLTRRQRLRRLERTLSRVPVGELSEPWRRERSRLAATIDSLAARTATDTWAREAGPWIEVLELRAASIEAAEPGLRWIAAAERRLGVVQPRAEHAARLDALVASGPEAWRARLSAWRGAVLEPTCTSSVGAAR